MSGDRIPVGFVALHKAYQDTVGRLTEIDPAPPPYRRRGPAQFAGAPFTWETVRIAAPEADEAGPLLCLAFSSGELVPQYWPDGWNAPEGCGIDRAAWDNEDAVAIFDAVVWRGGWGDFPKSMIGYAPCVSEKALTQWLAIRLPELRGKSASVAVALTPRHSREQAAEAPASQQTESPTRSEVDNPYDVPPFERTEQSGRPNAKKGILHIARKRIKRKEALAGIRKEAKEVHRFYQKLAALDWPPVKEDTVYEAVRKLRTEISDHL